MTSFDDLGISKPVLKAIKELGFEQPTPIQEQAIPHLLKGYNHFIGLAQTGTGKTAAFGLPLLERIDPLNNSTQALILAPTRELGQQIAEQLNLFSKHQEKVNVLAVYGGAAISNQIKALKRPQHVIIATPGRLIDLIQRKAVKLNELQFLVLDEADEMLNMGFKEELDKILSYTPEEKITWLFSATMPAEIKRIVKKYMVKPIEVRVDVKNEVNVNIDHQYVVVKRDDKTEALTRFLDIDDNMRALVFCRTRRETQKLAESLLKANYKADALHGDLSQKQRDRVMKRFKDHNLKILAATDVAARGIDVNDLTHVFHFTLPDDISYYTHRSGRTARAGKKGISIAFINGRENGKLRKLEKQLGIKFSNTEIPKAEDVMNNRIEEWCQSILQQKTKGKANDELIEKIKTLLSSLSKEELIEKILAKELEKLDHKKKGDLNFKNQTKTNRADKQKDRKHKKSSRDNKPRKNNGKGVKYFINLGSRDKISKHDLMDFICDVGNVKRSKIGHIDLQRSHSYFEIDNGSGKNFTDKFKGIVLEDGRELRVNRDN